MPQKPLPTKIEIEDVGYASWVECYEDLVKEDLQNQAAIEFQWDPYDYPGSSMVIEMDRIKSGAFDEIFPNLPTKDAMQVMLAIIDEDYTIKQRQLLLEFLNRIPTRTK